MANGTANVRTILWIGTSASLIGLAVFIFFAVEVLNAGPVTHFDQQVAERLKEHADAHPTVLWTLRVVTHVGGVPAMVGLAVLGVVVSLIRREYLLAALWVIAPAGGALLNQGVKTVIDRQRPPLELRDTAVTETNESYPSGHSQGSTIGFGTLAYALLLQLRSRSTRVLMVIGLTLLVVLIGFSRMYLRAHWFSDVLGGFGLGAAWLAVCVLGTEILRQRALLGRVT